MTKQKFLDTDAKEAIEAQLKAVNQQMAAPWAADCVEHIIQYFEQRIRKMIGQEKRLK